MGPNLTVKFDHLSEQPKQQVPEVLTFGPSPLSAGWQPSLFIPVQRSYFLFHRTRMPGRPHDPKTRSMLTTGMFFLYGLINCQFILYGSFIGLVWLGEGERSVGVCLNVVSLSLLIFFHGCLSLSYLDLLGEG